jgi:hypothetical protein
MGEIQNKYFTQEERAKIRNRSAFMLPNNPSQKGLTAEQIKRSLYEPILMMFDLMQKIEVDFPQGGGSGGSGGNVNVDLSNYYTKEETLALILTEIGNQYHFHAEIVKSTDDVKEANVLYLIKIESSTLSDVYEEFLLIDDAPIKIGDTSIDLSPYYTKTEVDKFVKELSDTFAELTTDIKDLLTRINGGGTFEPYDELLALINTKANQSSLEALREEVNKKAGQAELDKLAEDIDTNVNAKLQQIEDTIGDINSLLEEVNSLLDDVNGEVV